VKRRKIVPDATPVDFDDWSHVYEKLLNTSIWLSGEKDSYFDLYKVTCLERWTNLSARASMILDFGCGIGKLANLMAQAFPQSIIYGYDVSSKSLEIAREKWRHLSNLVFVSQLPDTETYDLITAANVFHHIERKNRKATLFHLQTLLNSDGMIAVFEHNPLNPLTLYTVRTCLFDADADLIRLSHFVELALNCNLEVLLKRYIVFFPKLLSFFRKLESTLGFLPLGAQYMLLLGRAQLKKHI